MAGECRAVPGTRLAGETESVWEVAYGAGHYVHRGIMSIGALSSSGHCDHRYLARCLVLCARGQVPRSL